MNNQELDRELLHELELLDLFNSDVSDDELYHAVIEYHPNDIAKIFDKLTVEKRKRLYKILSIEEIAPIFEHIDHKEIPNYFSELSIREV